MFLLNDVNDLYNQFSNKVFEAGALDRKTKELIAVACSVMADCTPCIEGHFGQAVNEGATKKQISEALAIVMSLSAGSKRAKYSELIEKLDNKNQGSIPADR
jgi:AhpD family alkylhydroperoxidase